MIIVSMTSFPGRLELVPIAFKHFIKKQTLKCDKYVLWLSRAEFDGEKSPDEIGLREIVDLGVEIHWCDEDSKIHIRHNSLKLWPNEYNLIIDEDIFYPVTYTQQLIDATKKYEKCVISYFSCYEIFTGYKKYELPRYRKPSLRNKYNGGLVCFPPNTFPQNCFKYSDIRDLICPYHDETWVNLFLKYNGTKVYGLHRINWRSLEHIHIEKKIVHLHDVHTQKGQKYSLDVVQFNRVLFVFPELYEIYNKLTYGFYRFHDKKELKFYAEFYGKIYMK